VFQHRSRLVLVLASLLALETETPASASTTDTESPTYRIAVHRNSQPFSSVGADERPIGFAADLLKEISAQSGARLELVPGWWNQHLKAFAEKRIDALCGISPDDTRDHAVMDYSIKLVTVHAVTFTLKGKPAVKHTDELRGRRVGLIEGSNSLTHLRQRNLPDTTLVVYANLSDFREGLRKGDCDVAISTSLSRSGLENTSDFERNFLSDLKVNFYLAVHKGDRRLLSIINEGVARALQDRQRPEALLATHPRSGGGSRGRLLLATPLPPQNRESRHGGGAGQPREIPLSRLHQPRDTHPDERHRGHDGSTDHEPSDQGAAGDGDDRAQLLGEPAADGERHPRVRAIRGG
jgi:ABC-type amino acid transport substrate-binding protein